MTIKFHKRTSLVNRTESHRRRKFRLQTISMLFAALFLLLILPDAYAKKYFKLKVGKYSFSGKTARNEHEREVGLGETKKLDKFKGMLFLFDKPAKYRFWMKGMVFPIDILWIRNDTIVHIEKNVPLRNKDESLPTYAPNVPADKVFEVNAGICEELDIKEGQKVEIKLMLYTIKQIMRPAGAFFAREFLNGVCKRVISFNKILIKTDNKEKVVRLLGVKALPSLPDFDTENKATDYLVKLIEGKQVVAELDLRHKDKAGRNYAYVLSAGNRGGRINFDLIKWGYASADRETPHSEMLKYILEEEKSRKSCKGLWAYIGCGE